MAGKDTPSMRQYHAAKGAHPDAILFFRMGDFYEMFYEDAVWAAAAPVGDRDTNAAIVGGITILAAPGGVDAIPAAWRAATEPVR